MADISGQTKVVFDDGLCQKTALIAVKNATAADTVDVGNIFRVIKRAGMVSDTGTTISNVTNTGTVLTIPAGPNQDGVWLLVVGVSF